MGLRGLNALPFNSPTARTAPRLCESHEAGAGFAEKTPESALHHAV